jgi:hypothetical protein
MKWFALLHLGIRTGNPRVLLGNPYPTRAKPLPVLTAHGYGFWRVWVRGTAGPVGYHGSATHANSTVFVQQLPSEPLHQSHRHIYQAQLPPLNALMFPRHLVSFPAPQLRMTLPLPSRPGVTLPPSRHSCMGLCIFHELHEACFMPPQARARLKCLAPDISPSNHSYTSVRARFHISSMR